MIYCWTGVAIWISHWRHLHEVWHCHWILWVSSGTCLSNSWHHSWHHSHLRHHWEAHASLCIWICQALGIAVLCSGCWLSSDSRVSSSCSLGHHLLLHEHLLGKHGLVLLVHLLMNSHLLVNHLLLVIHHLCLLWSGRRSVSILLSALGSGIHNWRSEHWRHHELVLAHEWSLELLLGRLFFLLLFQFGSFDKSLLLLDFGFFGSG